MKKIYIFILILIFFFIRKRKTRYFSNKVINDYIEYLRNNNFFHSHKENICSIPIYVINMEKSLKRKERIESDMKKYNIKYSRINAIDGSKIQKVGADTFSVPYENKKLIFI